MTYRPALVAIAAYLVLIAVAFLQLLVGSASTRPIIVGASAYLAGLTAFLISWRWAARRSVVARTPALGVVAVGGGLLGVWLVARFAIAASDHIGEPSSYYRIKVLVTSPVGDHNTAAGLLLVAVVAAVVLTSTDRRWWIAVGVATAGAIATLSRGAAVVLVAASLVGWTATAWRGIAARLSAAAAAVAGGVFALAALLDASPPAGAESRHGAVLGTSVMGRLDLAERGAEVAAEHPWLGAGFGSFAQHAADLPEPNHHAHQLLVHAAAEAGWLAALAVLVISASLLLGGWRLAASPLRTTALLGGGAILAHAQIEILGGLVVYEVLIGALLGLVVAGDHTSERLKPGGRLGPPSGRP